jgi:hypothetical protein
MRLSLSSEGAETPTGFTADKIKGVKVIFTLVADLKKSLRSNKLSE